MKKQYLLIFLAVMFGICIFLFTSFYNQAKQEAINNTNNKQLLYAQQAARGIEDFFNGWKATLSALAESDQIIDMNKAGKEDINLLFRVNQDRIRAITRLDAAGRIIYTFPYNRDALGRDITYQKHVREIISTHQSFVSDVFFAVQGYETVALHVPVFRNKIYMGTIAIAINFQALAKRYLEDIKIGKTGYAWMISRNGTELYCPVPGHTGKSVLENCKDFPTILDMAGEMLKGNQGVTTYTFDQIRGNKTEIVKKHAVYMPIKIGSNFWSIVVASSEDEILASLQSFRNKLIAIIAFLLLCGFVFAYYVLKARFVIGEEEKRRLSEQAMRASEEQYRLIAENTADLIIVLDMSLHITYVSPSIMRTHGFTVAEGMNLTIERLLTPESREIMLKAYKGEMKMEAAGNIDPGRIGVLELETYKKDGSVICMETSVSAQRDKQNKAIGILTVSRDITDRKQAEEKLKAAEETYRNLFMNSQIALYRTEIATGKMLEANDRLAQVIGFKNREELLASNFNLTEAYVDPEARKEIIAQLVEHGQINSYEVRFRMNNGEIKWVRFSAKLVPAKGWYEGVSEDITDIKQSGEEKRILEARLKQGEKMEAIGTLAGGIAHDFNNLLAGIQGFATMVLMNLNHDDQNYERLLRIEEQVQSGADLTKQLLGFARGGRHEVKIADMNEIVRKTSSMFGRTKKEITIQRKSAKDLWAVEVDTGQMEQVFLNLYVNAWHAMPGGGAIYMETENVILNDEKDLPFSVKPGKYVKITVTDTGTGMDEKTRVKIFEPFFTTKEMGRGTGLGLATVYGIIKGHEGMINVESKLGQGTTFTIHLPASEKVFVKEEKIAGEITSGTETILLVDDETMVMEVNKELLESMGYTIYVAGSGQEALAVYMEKKNEIGLIILDMIMPGISGSETFDRLREVNPDVKVLLSSGYSLTGDAQAIMDRGCNGFLQKPFRLEELSSKIREIFD